MATSRGGLCTDEEFIDLFERYGDRASQHLNCTVRAVYARRRAVEKRIGRELIPGISILQERSISAKAMLTAQVENGTVLIGSDCHYWGHISTAHVAFLEFIKRFKPRIVVLNGDVLDGGRISRHPPIGWEGTPTVLEELRYCQARLREIEKAAKGARLVWPAGNHCLRFESRLAQAAPEFEGIEGFHLKDHFPKWEPCWGIDINENVVIKHRFKNGIHATHNNTIWAGRTMVTGHLHSLKVTPFSDYNGTRWGVDSGTMAEPYGPQFLDYTEANPLNWRSGFVMLTFRDGKLLWPELVAVHDKGVIDFRGELIKV